MLTFRANVHTHSLQQQTSALEMLCMCDCKTDSIYFMHFVFSLLDPTKSNTVDPQWSP